MNPKNNFLALIILVLMVSCDKELPPFDERQGYIDGMINEDIVASINNKEDNFISVFYANNFVCEKVVYLDFTYKLNTDYGSLVIFFAFMDINKISGKCFDKFKVYTKQGQFIQNCDFKPVLAACYVNDGQCDLPYLPDSTQGSTIHIDKVTDKYITGKLDVNLLPQYDPPSYPWIKIRPRKIHLKTDLFVAVKL